MSAVMHRRIAEDLRIDGVMTPRVLRRLAVRALLGELVTYPKPGLVSLVDSGSHDDMDARTLLRSAFALRGYFERASAAGRANGSFASLRALGIAAEARMLRATDGVNAHRGAIFAIGLLAAAAGRRADRSLSLGHVVREEWGDALLHHRGDPASHGQAAHARYRSGGAIAEAAAGFPILHERVLPAYRATLAAGGSAHQARLQAFFVSMATLVDTNLLHRGGLDGLAYAQREATGFLNHGGALAATSHGRALQIHHAFRERRLSPGGSADMLAACLFVHAVDA